MEKNNYSNINSWRLCNSSDLKPFLNFGRVPLGNNLQSSQSKAELSETYPLSIMRCSKCNHFQLSVSVNPDSLYANNYTYLSSIGKSFVDHLKEYASWVSSNTTTSSRRRLPM